MKLLALCVSSLFSIGATIARDPHLRLMLAVCMLALVTIGCSTAKPARVFPSLETAMREAYTFGCIDYLLRNYKGVTEEQLENLKREVGECRPASKKYNLYETGFYGHDWYITAPEEK